jgi:hypothetical protein
MSLSIAVTALLDARKKYEKLNKEMHEAAQELSAVEAIVIGEAGVFGEYYKSVGHDTKCKHVPCVVDVQQTGVTVRYLLEP